MNANETERIIAPDGSERTAPSEQLEFNQCQEAVKRLTEYLSHELRPDEEMAVQHHLSQCRGCFAKFHFEETLLRTIRSHVGQVRAPGALRDKILHLIDRQDGVTMKR
ncbi:MAG: zf-HC2 domain-containing protein [Cytophagales bacterium]|nr:zf-HC2 domain-containing protein [Armatimonadota bacterium]